MTLFPRLILAHKRRDQGALACAERAQNVRQRNGSQPAPPNFLRACAVIYCGGRCARTPSTPVGPWTSVRLGTANRGGNQGGSEPRRTQRSRHTLRSWRALYRRTPDEPPFCGLAPRFRTRWQSACSCFVAVRSLCTNLCFP